MSKLIEPQLDKLLTPILVSGALLITQIPGHASSHKSVYKSAMICPEQTPSLVEARFSTEDFPYNNSLVRGKEIETWRNYQIKGSYWQATSFYEESTTVSFGPLFNAGIVESLTNLLSSNPTHANSLIEKVNSFAHSECDLEYEGLEAPNEIACENAIAALKYLQEMRSAPHHAVPSVEGGVALTWRHGSKDAFIEFYNDGEILALTSDTQGDRSTWMVEAYGLPNALRRIIDFINA